MTLEFAVERNATPATDAERVSMLQDPGFGRYFTDHMVSAEWELDGGWRNFRVGPLAPFSLHPSAAVLHYAQEIFEGLKAYRHADGSVWLFRPEANARRMQRSARRLALPELDEATFIQSIAELVRADEAWVPDPTDERSLYVRPYMFATEAFLGVRPSTRVTYSVIASPAGSYFPGGVDGIRLWVSSRYSRAGRGGTGAAKCGGNYAASLAAQMEAREQNCDQVLYLDLADGDTLEESGTMNFCAVTSDGDLLTPGLGTILEGVTRDSVLSLAASHGLNPVERHMGLRQLRADCEAGRVIEVFATGTAAVITPIVAFQGEGYEFTVGAGEPGKYSLQIRNNLLDIQYGHEADTRGWMHRVC